MPLGYLQGERLGESRGGMLQGAKHQDLAVHRMCCGTEAGSYLRLIDSCITQLKAQGPSRTCDESKEEEEDLAVHPASHLLHRTHTRKEGMDHLRSSNRPPPRPPPSPRNPPRSPPPPRGGPRGSSRRRSTQEDRSPLIMSVPAAPGFGGRVLGIGGESADRDFRDFT